MRLMKRAVLLTAAAMAVLCTGARAELPRRASLGVALDQAEAEAEGARVVGVLPGQTAARLGLHEGDVVVSASGKAIRNREDLVAYAQTLVADAPVSVVVARNGTRLPLDGRAVGRPREAYSAGTVTYGAVPFRGGQLADLLVLPRGVEHPPVVFLIQGFSCVSVESPDPDGSYHQLAAALLEAGIGFYRVEKPGVGDSRGGVRCVDIDYATELDAFRTAYRHLTSTLSVPAERVFMLGHSLGGLQAPMLAAERAPRGVAVYGTVLRNWAEYHQYLSLVQDFIEKGADPVARAEQSEHDREIIRRFYFGHQSPKQIAAERPDLAGSMRELLGWPGRGNTALGRDYHYLQDLSGLPLTRAWRDVHASVLSLYGASDTTAIDGEDQRRIADVVNHYRPGTAVYEEVPDTDHGMRRVGDRAEVRRQSGLTPPPNNPFSAAVAEHLVQWIRRCMSG